MAYLNNVQLIGNLGADPDLKVVGDNRPLATFSLATTRRWKDRDGEPLEKTHWHRIVAWGRQAELVGQLLEKGRLIYLEGELEPQSWEDKETGETRYRTQVHLRRFQLLPRGGNGAEAAEATEAEAPPPVEDEEIPF